MMNDVYVLCPTCSEEMKHWNQGIYECEECKTMIPLEDLAEYYSE